MFAKCYAKLAFSFGIFKKKPTFATKTGKKCSFSTSNAMPSTTDWQHPDEYRDLLVRVSGYTDYFNDMTEQLQNEIIARTESEEY